MRQALKNHRFLWKLCFKTAPGYMIYYLYDAFRYQMIIFLEHVLGIRWVLRCAEFHEPFWKALVYIGVILIINMLQIIPDGYFIHGWTFRTKPKIYRALKEQMFAKAAELDLFCYDDPKYYNDFVLAVSESERSIDRFLQMLNTAVQSITIFFTTGAFYLMTDATGFLFIGASLIAKLILSKKLNKLNYDVRLLDNPFMRKRDYVSRVFYLKDYAKELRLHPGAGDYLEQEFLEANDGILANNKAVSKKRTSLLFLNRYLFGDLIIDGLYITWLVFKATVLHAVAYSDAVVLFNRTGSMRNSMLRFADLLPMLQENGLYLAKIQSFLAYEPVIKQDEGESVPDSVGEIKLSHVSFRYNEKADETLQDISLTVKPGEHVAIVGYNGAGKTTLIKLLMRLYDPSAGEISYHGRNIKEYRPREYHKRIGVVFQDYQLYGASLAENVVMDSLAKEEIESGSDKITEALSRSGFGGKLSGLKNGLFTQVTTEFDPEGTDFSGGESQKIAISRAFYKDADILIMDEPSSALDPIAEYELNNAMRNAAEGKTVFYISHRLSTTRDADRILMLEKGRIIEEGTHEELLKKGGKYAEMWLLQAGKYE